MDTVNRVRVIVVNESFLNSILRDATTFGFLLLCIWASWKSDNLFWQFILGAIGFLWIITQLKAVLNSGDIKKFHSLNAAHRWLSERVKKEAAQ